MSQLFHISILSFLIDTCAIMKNPFEAFSSQDFLHYHLQVSSSSVVRFQYLQRICILVGRIPWNWTHLRPAFKDPLRPYLFWPLYFNNLTGIMLDTEGNHSIVIEWYNRLFCAKSIQVLANKMRDYVTSFSILKISFIILKTSF